MRFVILERFLLSFWSAPACHSGAPPTCHSGAVGDRISKVTARGIPKGVNSQKRIAK